MKGIYVLRMVKNGWIMTDDCGYISNDDLKEAMIFRSLHEFANWTIGTTPPQEVKPQRKRRKRKT